MVTNISQFSQYNNSFIIAKDDYHGNNATAIRTKDISQIEKNGGDIRFKTADGRVIGQMPDSEYTVEKIAQKIGNVIDLDA